MLHEFIAEHREEIILRSIGKSGTEPSRVGVVDHGVFLDQLSEELRIGVKTSTVQRARFQFRLPPLGPAVSTVVWRNYSDTRDAIIELAMERKVFIPIDDCSALDRIVDDAIAVAVALDPTSPPR